ncbi:hypothetical protein NIES4102_43540 (plasmid) [Chondrocystis sp. NIES-4102]|nr:hypothetical protein NIES4102_43540 [Chondrocystis sp. NIES-4102]
MIFSRAVKISLAVSLEVNKQKDKIISLVSEKEEESRNCLYLPKLLVSAWEGSSDEDRIVLSKLVNMPGESFQNHLVRWVNESDPPLRRVNDIWEIAGIVGQDRQ